MSILIELDFDEARKRKYQQGVIEHRTDAGQPFDGEPLAEAFDEMLDAANYFDEEGRRGNPVPAVVYAMVKSVAGWIQAEHRRRQDLHRTNDTRYEGAARTCSQ